MTRTFTSAAVIARLAAFLNGRPAAPRLALSCPAPLASYQVRFTANGNGGPAVAVSPGCMTDQITVNGAPQTLIWDTQGGLVTMIRGLLGP
jgi:hypothetical protein